MRASRAGSSRNPGGRRGFGPALPLRADEQRGDPTRTDPRAGRCATATRSSRRGLYAWRAATFTRPRLRGRCSHGSHVGSFSVPAGAAAGSYDAVTARLDGLADLGVNAIELMPVNEFGRATKLGLRAETPGPPPTPRTGRLRPWQRLVDEAHARGIAVLLDLVYNHYDGMARRRRLRCYDGDCPAGWAALLLPATRCNGAPRGVRSDFARAARPTASSTASGTGSRPTGSTGSAGTRCPVRAIDGRGTGARRSRPHRARQRPHAGASAGRHRRRRRPQGARPPSRALGVGPAASASTASGTASSARPPSRSRPPATTDATWTSSARWSPAATATTPSSASSAPRTTTPSATAARVFPQRVDGPDPGASPRASDRCLPPRSRSPSRGPDALHGPGAPGGGDLRADAHCPRLVAREARPRPGLLPRLSSAAPQPRRRVAGLLGARVEVVHFHAANKVIAYRRWDRGGDDVVIANLRNRAYT